MNPDRVTTALSKMFAEFLDFLSSTRRFFRSQKDQKWLSVFRVGYKTMGYGAWRDYKKHAKVSIVTIESLGQQAKEEVHLAAFKDEQRRAEKLEKILFEQNAARNDEHDVKVFKNLCDWLAHARTSEDLGEIKAKKQHGSCTWIEKDDTMLPFLSMDTPTPRLLWLTGRPGCGKTYVSAHIIGLLEQQYYRSAYFFCKTQIEEKRTALGIFRTMAWQLLQTIHIKAAIRFAKPCQRGEPLNLSHTCSIIEGLHDPDRPTWLVVDGLDECSENDQEEVLQRCGYLAKLFKVAIISRGTQKIENGLHAAVGNEFSHMRMTEEETKVDIENYLSQKVQEVAKQSPRLSANLQDEIVGMLSTGAKGMFLWVHIMTEQLAKLCLYENDTAIKAALHEYPTDLDGYYSRTLENISRMAPGIRRIALKLLQWIVCAFRALTVTELDYAISIDSESPHHGSRKRVYDSRKCLIDLCGPFVEIDPKNDTVKLTHASVKDFLLGQQTYTQLSIDMPSAHAYLAQCCLSYLCDERRSFVNVLDDDDQHMAHQKFKDHTELDCNKFLEYSSIHWFQHLAYQGTFRHAECLTLFHVFASSETLLVKWLQLFSFFERKSGSSTTLDLILDALCPSPASHCKDLAAIIHGKDFTTFRNHLGWAESGRFNRWQRMITWKWETLKDPSVTFVASYFDFAEIVQREISLGTARADSRNLHGLTPLILAARGGSVQTVKYLLKHKVSLDLQTKNLGHAALYEAVHDHDEKHWSRPGTYEVAHLLLEAGCNVNIRTRDGKNALRGLLNSPKDDQGQALIARELIRNGIELTAAMNDFAVQQNMPTVLQAMLDEGRSIYGYSVMQYLLNSTFHNQKSLLQLALEKERHLICKALINLGANVNLTAKKNQRPLLHTAILTVPDLVPLLLSHKADPMVADAVGDQPLHLAARKNLPRVAEQLVKAGADIEARNGEGQTPVELASHDGRSEAIHFLLTPQLPSITRWIIVLPFTFVFRILRILIDLFKSLFVQSSM